MIGRGHPLALAAAECLVSCNLKQPCWEAAHTVIEARQDILLTDQVATIAAIRRDWAAD